MTTKDVISHTHMCVSCRHLLRVTRSVKKDREGHHIGFKFSAACDKSKTRRNPWVALFCSRFEWMEAQQTMKSWLKFADECKKEEKKEDSELNKRGFKDSEPVGKPKKRDPAAGP